MSAATDSHRKLCVWLRKVETGEVRMHTSDLDPRYVDGLNYMWVDGNFSCDCNRHLFFERAKDPEFDDDDDDGSECGEEAYVIDRATLDGEPIDLVGPSW